LTSTLLLLDDLQSIFVSQKKTKETKYDRCRGYISNVIGINA